MAQHQPAAGPRPAGSRNCETSSCPSALCWGRTSRRPRGSSCSVSRPTCCTRGASQWTLWRAPNQQREGSKLKHGGKKTLTHSLTLLPGCRSQHQFRSPRERTASGPLESSGRTGERWAGHARNQPGHR